MSFSSHRCGDGPNPFSLRWKSDVKTFVKKMQRLKTLIMRSIPMGDARGISGSDELFRGESQVRQGKIRLTAGLQRILLRR